MKKLYAISTLIFVLFSCSETDEFNQKENAARQPIKVVNALDPTKLAKVIVWPGVEHAERHLYFYPNGLLKKITVSNGGLLQDFVYDSNQDLITIHRPSNGIIYATNFTYDSAHRVTSINGQTVNYDAVNNKYILNYTPIASSDPECLGCYDALIEHSIDLSSEYLATFDLFTYEEYIVGQTPVHYNSHGIYAGYDINGNMGYTGDWIDPSHSTYSHDNKVNPLKAAMLPFGRAVAALGSNTESRMALGIYNSTNNVIFNSYGNDPAGQTTGYAIEYNANDLPKRTTANSYYFGVLESSHLSALYYYQGDVIP